MGRSSLNALRQIGSLGGPKQSKGYPISVDFGADSLKVVQLGPGEKPTLVAAAALETPAELRSDPAERLAFQMAQLPSVVRLAGFRGKRAACLLPAALTYTTHLQVPRGDAAAIESGARIAVASQLQCDPSALVMRHYEVGTSAQDASKTEVVVMAASRGLVGRLMGALAAAKLEPVGMHTEPVALLRAFQGLGMTPADDVTLYLDLGFGTTKALIAEGPRLLFARTIEIGGRSMDAELSRRRKLSADNCHELRLGCVEFSGVKRAPQAAVSGLNTQGAARVGQNGLRMPGELADNRKAPSVLPDVGETLEMLGDEVAMCLRYYQSLFPAKPVARAVMTGGESRLLGLCRRLAGAVRVPVQAGDPARALLRSGKEPAAGVDVNAAMPGWAAVMGLGLCPTDL
jgi:Tfp pilus assembly PilM family ATPase